MSRLTMEQLDSIRSLMPYATAQEREELERILSRELEAQIEAEAARQKADAERSFYEFVRQAWPILEPDQPFIDNWHVGMICRHLEHAAGTPNYNLLVNIPPGCMKSRLTCVLWPAWIWGPYSWPEARFLFASYSQELSTRDSVDCRNLIESEWYQQRWGDRFRLADDANLKTYYRTDRQGWRLATSVGGRGTGEHPDFIGIDDPHNVRQAESDAERQHALDWIDGTISTRGRIRGVRKVIIMQRLHELDLSGHVLEKGGTWDHICLPMRFEPGRMQPTQIGESDQRTEAGELLWPAAFPEQTVAAIETDLGPLRAAGQLQQRPTAADGDIFRQEWFRIVPAAPTDGKAVLYWDKAGTKGGGDYSVGTLMVEAENHGARKWYIAAQWRGQWGIDERNRVIEQSAAVASQQYRSLTVWVEQEPGSGGKESAEYTLRQLAGYTVKADKVTGSKQTRWEPYAAQLAAGNVLLVKGDWNRQFIDEHIAAPAGRHDDQIDSAAGAFNKLAGRRTIDLAEWVKVM